MATTRYGTSSSRLAHPGVAGIVGGIVAAMVMLIFWTVVSATTGASGLEPLHLIGATFFGEEALARPLASSAIGLLTHIVVGAGFGWLFGVASRRIQSTPLLLAAGLAYAAAIFLVMTFLVLPWVNPLMASRVDAGWFFVYHLAFGLLLPLTMVVARRHPTRAWFGEGERSSWI